MGFGKGDGAVLADEEGGGQRQGPAGVGGVVVGEACVGEGDVDEDGAVVAAVRRRDGVGEAVLGGYGGSGIGQDGEGQGVLAEGKVVLARGLGGDGEKKSSAASQGGVEVAPELELGDAVGAPATAEKIQNDGAEGEDVGQVDGLAGSGVGEGEIGRGGAGGENAVLNAAGEKLCGGGLRDGEALGLDEGSGVAGDAV